jgi:hypothetical protein
MTCEDTSRFTHPSIVPILNVLIMMTTSTATAAPVGSIADPSELHDWFDVARLVRPAPSTMAIAWLLLAITGATLSVGGFGALRRLVNAWPTRRRASSRELRDRLALEIRAAIRGACAYYLTKTWCLQKSAALVCLLRWHGVPAEVVIGVTRLPFQAHAWVEADRAVLNGPATLKTHMLVIERW